MEREITESQTNANQINSHQQKDLSSSEEKQQDSKDKKKKKKNCYKSKKHGDKICPDITLEKNTGGKIRIPVSAIHFSTYEELEK